MQKSKGMQILEEKGLLDAIGYIVAKKRHIPYKYLKHIILGCYPKLALNKNEYKTFQLAKNHFKEHYINIIAINPLFFMQNLKKHIAWIESKEFQECYGNIFTSNASTKIESSHLDSIRTQNTDNNIESKQADSLTWANNAKNSIVTPPPPL